jgi:hypothetical protein
MLVMRSDFAKAARTSTILALREMGTGHIKNWNNVTSACQCVSCINARVDSLCSRTYVEVLLWCDLCFSLLFLDVFWMFLDWMLLDVFGCYTDVFLDFFIIIFFIFIFFLDVLDVCMDILSPLMLKYFPKI